MLPIEIKNRIENQLSAKIDSCRSIGGGCISDSSIIHLSSGQTYFLKVNNHVPKDMFTKEANGLDEIEKSKAIRVPKVILTSNNFILMEAIEAGTKSKNFFEDFGIAFAKMHKHSSKQYGFYEDNYIGSTSQINIPAENEKYDWAKFYLNNRLLFQFELAEKKWIC